jgi:hypothetical protein
MSAVEWIPLAESGRWRNALEGIEHGFAQLPEYSVAAARVTGHDAGLWTLHTPTGRAVCPVGKRPAPGGGFDITTPLGFGGFAIVGDPVELASEWTGFWRAQGALAAYVQLSPALDAVNAGAALAGFDALLRPSRECWVWDIAREPEALAAGMHPKHRQLLHKWQREHAGLAWDRAELEPAFNRLYAQFLERQDVGRAYRYTADAIAVLASSPGALWVGARDAAGAIEAVTLFLWHGEQADSFLNAATPEGRWHSRGLYWEGALRLRRLGVRRMNLGGGVSDGDALSGFKQRLGASPVRSQALRQVLDPEGFAAACARAGKPVDATGRFPPWLD